MAARWLILPVAGLCLVGAPAQPHSDRPMSLHNRTLLNRAAVLGLRTIEIMLATSDGGFERAKTLVLRAGGRVGYANATVGYVRAEVPIESTLALVSDSAIEAYQISAQSEGAWDYDLRTERSALGFRSLEVRPTGGVGLATPEQPLPALSVAQSRQNGFTADEDTGLDEWFRAHPNRDGRGVTIALLETAQPELNHPTLATAKTLDGRDVPKIAGVINSFDPSEADRTRVDLDTEIDAASTWQRIGHRTYILPRAGRYRFGQLMLPSGEHLFHHFGVVQDQGSGEIWIDTDGDADFHDERPMSDVNARVDVGVLKLLRPQPVDVSFVVSKRSQKSVHVYVSRSDHYAMVVSVAAGSKTEDGLAYGVAPNARVLLVRHYAGQFDLRQMIEGYILAAERPDVDLLGAASGYSFVPETARGFAAILFSRIIGAYGKPIFQSAGNSGLRMTTSLSLGDALAVGGSLGPSTFAAFVGGATLPGLMVHPSSAAGPSIDGSLTPDFLAPVHRIAAGLWNGGRSVAVPKNAPTRVLPRGYQNSCCTSASAPYAAGVAALLIGAAKQEGLSYSFERLRRALRVGARFLDGWPAHQQGHGVLNVEAAWRELKKPIDIPRIRAASNVVHPLASYAPARAVGRGLFEWEGWSVGAVGRRNIFLTRESGSPDPVAYRVSWIGNDGSFTVPRSIALPLDTTVALPVDIRIRATGVHSAILNLHDPASDAIVFRVPATIVAPERFDPRTLTMRLGGTVGVMRRNAHYIAVPEGIGALIVDLEVFRGSTRVNIVPGHSLYSPQEQTRPMPGRTFTRGRYTVVFPSPPRGTWTIDADNISLRSEPDPALVSAEPVEYAVTVRLQRASLRTRTVDASRIAVDVETAGAPIAEPVLQTSVGALRAYHGRILASGLPNIHEIVVPTDASALALQLRASDPNTAPLELNLYDCTSGECFYFDSTIPSAPRHAMIVRRPKPGRWLATVNSAPLPSIDAAFDLHVVVASAARRHAVRRGDIVDPGPRRTLASGETAVVLCELIDAAVERDEIANAWENRAFLPKRPQSPAAAGMTIHVVR